MDAPAPVNAFRLNPVDGIFRRLGLRLLPPRCLLCRAPGANGRELCLACANDLPWNRSSCARCALPLPAPAAACGDCLQHPPPFARLLAPLCYADPLDALVQRFKFRHDLAAGVLLADLLGDALAAVPDDPATRPDLLVPVPLHAKRLAERGYNQSLELAKRIAPALRLRIDAAALARTRATEVQSGLDAKARRQNVHDAFTADAARVCDRHIALLDDVATTTATAHECTRALLRAGARSVHVWVLARAAARRE